jgi:hypothetical protein
MATPDRDDRQVAGAQPHLITTAMQQETASQMDNALRDRDDRGGDRCELTTLLSTEG